MVGQSRVSSDPKDLEPLTPNHILRLRTVEHAPLGGLLVDGTYRRHWKHAQILADHFWKRWRREYVHTLRMRQCHVEHFRNLEVDDVGLVVEPMLPRNRWTLGRV